MAIGLTIGLAVTLASTCENPVLASTTQWIGGTAEAEPVLREMQQEALDDLASSAYLAIDRQTARSLVADDLANGPYHYLVKAGIVGEAASLHPQAGITFGVDVDTDHVAYVSSFRLIRSSVTSEVAVVVVSQAQIVGVVVTCNAAE